MTFRRGGSCLKKKGCGRLRWFITLICGLSYAIIRSQVELTDLTLLSGADRVVSASHSPSDDVDIAMAPCTE